ncbi:helix-turn-helix domain-containing protein [Nocardia huaxiensis]|uniref:Helix-turn-helix transcriptional regulator n=1 Tax=Nocardia huaxiensis TaxID=2755382 RepID=A0A7D6ZVD8_9NOCA|nr:helix-turn-helix transcriptional regulator [Nocardia huaxiensis]QLY29649.1 helix-turn-helix transcriptional regulator [Nocardia huaxiensis]UFS96776.1 helix-turn-helix transcriptional regulator [Nocardia huaxiensis]
MNHPEEGAHPTAAAVANAVAPQSHPRQQLAAELRRLRGVAGISGRELAKLVGISQSTLSRIEAGHAVPPLPQVLDWAKAVGAEPDSQQLLRTLTEAAHTPEVQDWAASLADRPHLQDDVRAFEEDAAVVRNFQPALVPGLLQTADYARRVFATFDPPYTPDALTAALAARLERQRVLYDPAKKFEFLMTEAALRFRPGPHRLLLAQLDRIISIETLESVTIGVIPQDIEATTTIPHGFVIYENEDHALASAEPIPGSMVTRGPDLVDAHRRRWAALTRMALFDTDARAFLAGLRDEIHRIATH